MTDRENIRAYIEKLHIEHRGSEGDSIFRKALRTVLFYIDSMQEEPSETKSKCMYTNDNYTDEDRQVLCDGCEEAVSDGCIYNRTLEERQHSCKYCSAACQARIEEPSIPDIVDEHFDEMLGEEPVSSIWHDASEEPKPNMELICVGQYGNPLVLSSNSNSFKERYISKWAYFNDLLNLSNVQRTVKNWKEPVSAIDFEQELYKAFGHVKDFTLCLKIARRFYEMGRKYHEPVSEDLGEYINELSKQFPEVSFAKLSRIAVRVAKWQKEQMMAKAIDGHATFEFYGLDSKTYGTIAHNPICLDDLGLKDTDKVKVIVIKEE